MDCIYTITTVTNEEFPQCRCVGFYFDLNIATKEVENNSCDINEAGHYTYCVIEKVKPGLYYYPRKETWFQWDYDKKEYIIIKEKPKLFEKIGGFGIG